MKPSRLATVIYAVPDLEKAKIWYTKAFEQEPYFDEPFYVGFNIGGCELGLDPNTPIQEGSTLAYWQIQDTQKDFGQLIALEATAVDEPTDVGGGTLVATVKDPFGNKIGLIQLP